jgi:tetratricopeptide (TPR) repeat protein
MSVFFRKTCFCIVIFLSAALLPAYAEDSVGELNRQGLKYQHEGKLDLAFNEFQKALEIDPNNTDALYNMASVYMSKKEYGKAAERFEKLISSNPNDGDAHYNLAVAYFGLKEYGKAGENYDKSQALNFVSETTKYFGELLNHYRYREVEFKYMSIYDAKPGEKVIKLKGNVVGDDLLIADTLKVIEPLSGVYKNGMFQLVEMKYLGVSEKDQNATEFLFKVIWNDNTSKTFRVTYSKSDVAKTQIHVVEEGSQH